MNAANSFHLIPGCQVNQDSEQLDCDLEQLTSASQLLPQFDSLKKVSSTSLSLPKKNTLSKKKAFITPDNSLQSKQILRFTTLSNEQYLLPKTIKFKKRVLLAIKDKQLNILWFQGKIKSTLGLDQLTLQQIVPTAHLQASIGYQSNIPLLNHFISDPNNYFFSQSSHDSTFQLSQRLPSENMAQCHYLRQWAKIKTYYGMSIPEHERIYWNKKFNQQCLNNG